MGDFPTLAVAVIIETAGGEKPSKRREFTATNPSGNHTLMKG